MSNASSDFDDTCGVTWNAAKGELLFTVCQLNRILRWRPEAPTTFTTVRPGAEHQDGMTGLALAPDGSLLVTEVEHHALTRSTNGYDHPVTVVSSFQGVPFATPWTVVARWDGNIYFADPPPYWTEDAKNLFRVDPAGELHLFDRFEQGDRSEGGATGVALSADENSLYVTASSHSGDGQILRYTLDAAGEPIAQTVIVEDNAAGANGICVDLAENLYLASGAGGVRMYTPNGDYVGAIAAPGANDCAFGGDDMKTLFITTSGSAAGSINLYRVAMNVPGLP